MELKITKKTTLDNYCKKKETYYVKEKILRYIWVYVDYNSNRNTLLSLITYFTIFFVIMCAPSFLILNLFMNKHFFYYGLILATFLSSLVTYGIVLENRCNFGNYQDAENFIKEKMANNIIKKNFKSKNKTILTFKLKGDIVEVIKNEKYDI